MPHPLLQIAEEYLRNEVTPQAQAIDADPAALRVALEGLAKRNLLSLKRPVEYGGPDIPEADFRAFQELVASVSGSLSFLQTQHQSAAGLIARGHNDELKKRYLPKMANGEVLVGIGFSQLRRKGPPIMRATPTEGGYILTGLVPWVTGYTFFPEYLVAAALEDGSALFAVVPLKEEECVQVSAPMKLAAMESAQTVAITYRDYFLPASQVTAIQPPGWIQNNDQINVALQRHFALGCCKGALDVLQQAAEAKGLPFLFEAHASLTKELDACREAAGVDPADGLATADRLNARAWTIELAVRCAQAAVSACSGAANSMAHPAQRIYREALVYTVSAQTIDVMEATLKRLVRTL